MPTFTPAVAPFAGSSNEVTYSVSRMQYGDGYSQRAPRGINAESEKVSLEWSSLTHAEADTIQAFFNARAGHESFTYTPPWTSTAKEWTVAKVRRINGQLLAALTCELTQEFDL